MIRHIFAKDCRLLWPLILLVAAAQGANAVIWIMLGTFREPREFVLQAYLFSLVPLLTMAVLIVSVVHQDPIPGVRQDWLVRPIKRCDLLLAKLLFVVAAAHGPLLIADVIEGLTAGFAFPSAVGAAITRGIVVFCFLSLPVALLASVTRSLTEVAVGAIAVVIYCLAFGILARGRGPSPPPLAGSGLLWILPTIWAVLIVVAAAVVLPSQYFRRSTAHSRAIIAIAVGLVMCVLFVPSRIGFALQRSAAIEPGAADALSLAFDPNMHQPLRVPGSFADSTKPNTTLGPAGTAVSVFVPLRVTNLPAGTLLLSDRSEIRLLDASGATVYQGTTHLSVDGRASVADARLTVWPEAGAQVSANAHHLIFIPLDVYARVKNQPVRLEMDYFLTLMRPDAVESLAALNDKRSLAGLGSCATRVDSDEDEIEVACRAAGKTASCMTAVLQDESSGLKNPQIRVCDPDYSQYYVALIPDSLNRFTMHVPFFDPTGLANYPVDGSKLRDAHLVIHTYHPVDHFTRHMVIPEIRLADWATRPRAIAPVSN